MKKSIKRIGVHKASWMLAVCFTCAMLVESIVEIPSAMHKSASEVSWTLAVPLIMGLGSYVCGLVFFFVYNVLAKKFGGIEIELDETNRPNRIR